MSACVALQAAAEFKAECSLTFESKQMRKSQGSKQGEGIWGKEWGCDEEADTP